MNMNVSLTEDLGVFVKAKVASGRYASSSEVVREALRLMEQRDHVQAEKLVWLRQSWQAGIASGDVGDIDFAELKREARDRLPTQT